MKRYKAESTKKKRIWHKKAIEWNDYYPEGARVPRIWPDGSVQK